MIRTGLHSDRVQSFLAYVIENCKKYTSAELSIPKETESRKRVIKGVALSLSFLLGDLKSSIMNSDQAKAGQYYDELEKVINYLITNNW